jgi:hypothetical protein
MVHVETSCAASALPTLGARLKTSYLRKNRRPDPTAPSQRRIFIVRNARVRVAGEANRTESNSRRRSGLSRPA